MKETKMNTPRVVHSQSSVPVSRRQFLKGGGCGMAAIAAGLSFPSLFLNRTRAATGQNPNEFIRLGFIGVGNQGMNNLRAFMKNAVAVCDVDKGHLAVAKRRVEETNNRPCADFTHYQKLLEDKSIDGVVVSTPDHWHALPAIHACQAGKDVYCEKPMALFIAEGQALVKAVRRYKRVFQTGSQQRSDRKFLKGCEYVRSGRIGPVHSVEVGLPGVNWPKGETTGGPQADVPAELDYDLWLGPAPWRPYHKNRVHYLFRFFWDYSGGQMTNWGAHHLDIAQWGLGMDDSGPVEIEPVGETVFHSDRVYETPQKFEVRYRYANGSVINCSSGSGKYRGGTLFKGGKGTLFVTRGAVESEPEEILDEPLGANDVRLYSSTDHHQNWLDCIKTRRDPICSVEIGHRSATICHLGNIAVRSGKKIQWDPQKEVVVGDAELASQISRAYRKPWTLPRLEP